MAWAGWQQQGGWGQQQQQQPQQQQQQGWGQQAGGMGMGMSNGNYGGGSQMQQQYQQMQQKQQQAQAGWQGQPQQQQQQQPQMQAQQAARPAGGPAQGNTLVVTGCTHATVGGIVRGTFQLSTENHGKPAYKKDGQVNGLDVMIYYWDERDGPGFNGWWFGPVIGGDQVWAYHTEKAATTPPSTGWKVPYDGPVDPTFVIAAKGAAAAQPQQQAQQQQQWGQQAQQQNAWGQKGGHGNMQQMQQEQMRMQQQRLQEQRRQQEEMKKKQAAENAKRMDEMRRKQEEEQKKRLEENRKKLEEANKKRIEDQKAKMEEIRKKQEELAKKKEEELKRKQEEMKKKKEELESVGKLRRAIQKYRGSMPANHDALKQEFAEVVAAETSKLDAQKEALTKEIEDAETFVKTKLENIEKKKKEEEEKKKAEEERRRALKAKAEELVKEFTTMVEAAETSSKGVVEEADPFSKENDEKELKLAQIKSAAAAVEAASEDFEEKFKACQEFSVKNGAAMKNTPPIAGEAPCTAAADMQKLVGRMNAAKSSSAAAVRMANLSKEVRTKKMEAKDIFEKQQAAFTKFDTDKDGLLSKKEVKSLAKGLYGFDCKVETLDFIFTVLVADGGKGVKKTDLQRLKVMIGVAREKAMDDKRQADRLAKEKKIADLKVELEEKVQELTKEANSTQEEVLKLEKQVGGLPGQVKGSVGAAQAKAVKSAEMVEAAKAAEEAMASTKTTVATSKENLKGLTTEEAELKVFVASASKKLENQLSLCETRIGKVANLLTKFMSDASKKNDAELEQLRADALAMLRFHQGAKQQSNAEVFDSMDGDKDESISEADFIKFFGSCEKEPKEAKEGEEAEDAGIAEGDLSRLFAYLDSEKEGAISKDNFVNMIRQFMKVLKATVISDGCSIKDSKTVRRLEPDEVIEVIKGPIMEESMGLGRLQVKALSDGVEGWLTPVGNQGTVFLKEGGGTMKVVKETILTGSFKIGDKDDKKTKKLKAGEIVEVREWGRKDDATGLTRTKVRVKSDGTIGWVTSIGNTGITFLQTV
mmetsp:Transcript_9346/g.16265  ORF Transcript_9346/g.16265 Transcript_9346/m.16265 type:complete len:1041 (-) Transcript_9346:62-3184(-)